MKPLLEHYEVVDLNLGISIVETRVLVIDSHGDISIRILKSE